MIVFEFIWPESDLLFIIMTIETFIMTFIMFKFTKNSIIYLRKEKFIKKLLIPYFVLVILTLLANLVGHLIANS